jgi:hypothetical protein
MKKVMNKKFIVITSAVSVAIAIVAIIMIAIANNPVSKATDKDYVTPLKTAIYMVNYDEEYDINNMNGMQYLEDCGLTDISIHKPSNDEYKFIKKWYKEAYGSEPDRTYRKDFLLTANYKGLYTIGSYGNLIFVEKTSSPVACFEVDSDRENCSAGKTSIELNPNGEQHIISDDALIGLDTVITNIHKDPGNSDYFRDSQKFVDELFSSDESGAPKFIVKKYVA